MISDEESVHSDTDVDTNLDSSRLENLHWCGCHNCIIMPTLIESKCCKEFGSLLGDKLVSCITDNEYFEDICLKRHILESAHIQNQRYLGKFKDSKTISNKSYRFSAYRQYTAWVHYYERLGRNNRLVIPSCVVKKIRDTFPSVDGSYIGFKDIYGII